MPATGLTAIQIRQGHPDFLDLPWQLPLAEWQGKSNRLVQVPRGLSRHEVLFVSYGKVIYALKELPLRIGQSEYEVLRGLEERKLPAVEAVGLVKARTGVESEEGEESSVLITRFLEGSLPSSRTATITGTRSTTSRASSPRSGRPHCCSTRSRSSRPPSRASSTAASP